MARRDRSHSTFSSDSIGTSTDSSGSDVSTPPSTPPPRISKKRGRDALNTSNMCDKGRSRSKKARIHSPVRAKKKAEKTKRRSRHKELTPRDQCIHIARWITHGLDMFCDLKQVIQVCLLLEQDEAIEDGDLTDAQAKIAHTNILNNIDDHTHAHYKRTFEYVTDHAPYLGNLIGKKKKHDKLAYIISEMQHMINHTRSEDASRLKSRMGTYAAPVPDKALVNPPIGDDSKSHSKMGFNHLQLDPMLCPAQFLIEYNKDSTEVRKRIQARSLKVTAALWPAYLYPGDSPGKDFDPDDIIEGLFRGYLLSRVAKHIFTSPSSALSAGVSNGTHPCNAKIHGMSTVEAEHIAYAAVQAHFGISSLDKWKDKDGLFHYSDFYYRITRLIRERRDGEWVDSLLAYFNEKLFSNENGVKPTYSGGAECLDDDDMVAMERQLAARATRASQSSTLNQEPRQSPLPPSSPQASIKDIPANDLVEPARSPTPAPPVRSPTPAPPAPITSSIDNLFDDDPLTEEEQDVPQPAKRTRKGCATNPRNAPTKRKFKK
ncbi:uncharacterized protein EDB93DRAFT_1109329 [Suillus bovinus]|uniref:uncharacterized protein n=1 Tax=Suillus bovinus TaxID=48563 RepID=UPI001B882F66|nr:uncharacterized protein EDB93DRAFT_1109329 [Suillus bovinus]KAG2127288.1 hypothetical protein EDB93DRAFT_1109329 [Suillus bovinus]